MDLFPTHILLDILMPIIMADKLPDNAEHLWLICISRVSMLLASPFFALMVLTSLTKPEVIGFPCLSMAPSATMIMFSLVPLERV